MLFNKVIGPAILLVVAMFCVALIFYPPITIGFTITLLAQALTSTCLAIGFLQDD